MHGPTGEVPAVDRNIARALVAAAGVVVLTAPVIAAPLALQDGWLSPRFALFTAAALAGAWLYFSAAAGVVRRLRRS